MYFFLNEHFYGFWSHSAGKVCTKHFLCRLLFICESAGNGSSLEVNPLAWWVTIFNKSLLSQLQEGAHLHFLVIQLWVSSMVMCVLWAIIVLKRVQSRAPALQVKKKMKWNIFFSNFNISKISLDCYYVSWTCSKRVVRHIVYFNFPWLSEVSVIYYSTIKSSEVQ